jgi:hypothetical protein
MNKPLPIPDAPVKQLRLAPGNLIADRYNIIGTDHVVCRVYRAFDIGKQHGRWTITSYNESELPSGFEPIEWKQLDADCPRYHWFGEITDPDKVQAAIDATFPGYAPEQHIEDAGHQARYETYRRCAPEFRAIASEHRCPSCGTFQHDARGQRCPPCEAYDIAPADQAENN